MESQNLELDTSVERVAEYKFEPIKGFPMLNWKGKRPFKGTKYFPAQLKEVHGEDINGWLNKIFWGDNIQVMSHLLKEYRGKVDLVYIDPPFDSKADYKKKINLKGKEVSSDTSLLEDKQYTDIWSNDEYLQFMYERLVLLRELLSNTGSIYLHCDPTKGHYLKCIMDEIFGSDNFRNEIIWCYKTSLRSSPNAFGKDHDTILFYSKTNLAQIHPDKADFPSSASTLKRWGPYADENGFVSNKHFAGSASTIIDTEDESKGFNIYYGIPRDWWEISSNVSKGNTDEVRFGKYPTQKPEGLIGRIIKASSSEGSIVFDCFMGSGTTMAVAQKLGRRFIGADINLGAIQVTTKRLLNIIEENKSSALIKDDEYKGCGFEVFNVNNYDIFKNPVQAKDLLVEALEIDPLGNSSYFDGMKDGQKVKIMPVNRIATKADISDLITNLDYKAYEELSKENTKAKVDDILLVCMGHDPDIKGHFKNECPYNINIEIYDILKDGSELVFKRESEAKIVIVGNKLKIEKFYPNGLLEKLRQDGTEVKDYREMVESIMIDTNYDGSVFEPKIVDIPDKKELVTGEYELPADRGTVAIKIADLLSETYFEVISNG